MDPVVPEGTKPDLAVAGEETKMSRRRVTVLLLSAGSPGDFTIIKGLKKSARYNVTLHAADMDPLKGNLYLPEIDSAHIVPRYDAPNYWDVVFGLVRKFGVEVLMDDLDEGLPSLASREHELKNLGCNIVLPDAESLRICLDKALSSHALFRVVPQPKEEMVGYGSVWPKEATKKLKKYRGRCILKPSNLRGGSGVYLATSKEELIFYADKLSKDGPFLIQEYIIGEEYNCSTLHDLNGRLIYAATRLKLETRLVKSNTIAAEVVDYPPVRDAALDAISKLGLDRGFNNVEIIVRDNMPYVIDVNGGRWAGQDMNLLASGINQAEFYLDLALGVPVEPIEVPIGVISLKIKSDVLINRSKLDQVVRSGVES